MICSSDRSLRQRRLWRSLTFWLLAICFVGFGSGAARAQGTAVVAEGEAAAIVGEAVVPTLTRSLVDILDEMLLGTEGRIAAAEGRLVARTVLTRAVGRDVVVRSVGRRVIVVEVREREPGALDVFRQIAETNASWQNYMLNSVDQHCPLGSATVYVQKQGPYNVECNDAGQRHAEQQ